MDETVWITLGFTVVISLIGAVYRLITSKMDKMDVKVDKLAEKFDSSALGVLMEKVVQLEMSRLKFDRFMEEVIPTRLKDMDSEFYGTISNTEAELKRRIEVLENKARGV